MMKKIIITLFSLILITLSSLSVSAQSSEHIYDEAGLLQDFEISSLESKLTNTSEEYGCEVIVATTDYLYKDAMLQARDILQEHFEYINNEDDSGICLLVSMSERKYGIYVLGEADGKIFKDSDLDELEETIKPYLSEGDVYNALHAYADNCEETIEYYKSVKVRPLWFLISLGAGIVLAFVVVLIMKSQLKSVRFQPAANNYLKADSLNVTESRDIFLYSTVVRTEKPKANTSSGGGGSGSGRSGSF